MKFLILVGLLVTASSSPLRPADIEVINFLRRRFGLSLKPIQNEDSAVSSSFRSDRYIANGDPDCPPGLLKNVFGVCVEPIIEQKVFVYTSPETKRKKPAVPVQAPLPRNNIVVVNQLDENERRNNALFFRPPQIEEEVFVNPNDGQFQTLQNVAHFQSTRGSSKIEELNEPTFIITLNNNENPENNVIQFPNDIIEESAQFLPLDDVQGLTPVVIPLDTLDVSQNNDALLFQQNFQQGGNGRQDGSGGVNPSSALNSLRRRNKSEKERYAKLSNLARGANFARPIETGRLLSNSGANQHSPLFNSGYSGYASNIGPSFSALDFNANNIGHPILHQRGVFPQLIPNFSGLNANGVNLQGNQGFRYGYNDNFGVHNGGFGNTLGTNPSNLAFSTGNFQNFQRPPSNSNLERYNLRSTASSNDLPQGETLSPNSIGLPSRSYSYDSSEETASSQSKKVQPEAADPSSQSVSSKGNSGTQDIQASTRIKDRHEHESSSHHSSAHTNTEFPNAEVSNVNQGEKQSSSKNELATGTESSFSEGESGSKLEATEISKRKTISSSNNLSPHKDNVAEESQSTFEGSFTKEEDKIFGGLGDKSTDTRSSSDLSGHISQGNSIFFSSKIGEVADGESSNLAQSEVTSTLENKSSSQIYSNSIDSKSKDGRSFIKINISSIKDFPVVFVRFNDEKKTNKKSN